MSLHTLANHLQSAGRGEDKVLVHMTPGEVNGLQSLAMAHGGSLTINPETGLPEAGILSSLLPIVAGAFLGPAGLGLTAMQTGLAVGALGTAATGSLGKGLMMGFGAYGGAGLGEGLMSAGASAMPNAAGNVAANSVDDIAKAAVESTKNSQIGQLTASSAPTTAAANTLNPVTNAGGFSGYQSANLAQGPFANPNVTAYGGTVVPNTAPITQGVQTQNTIMSGGVKPPTTYTAPVAPTPVSPAPSAAPVSNFDKVGAGIKDVTSSGTKAWNFVKEHPGPFIGVGVGALQEIQEQKAKDAAAAAAGSGSPGMIRPYDMSVAQNRSAYAPNASTAEREYFTNPRFIPREPYAVAKEGGLMNLAVGGAVEQMSAENAVGDNTMYPQSQIQTTMYSNPMVQRPIPNDVINAGVDAPTDPYTGEPRFAPGGLTVGAATEPTTSSKYTYDPATMKYTQTTTTTPAASNPANNPFFGKIGIPGFGYQPHVGIGMAPGIYSGLGIIGGGALNPAIFGALAQQQAQKPTTTTETSGGIATPFVPQQTQTQPANPIAPNINIPPQQDVNQQLGLQAFYPMMEQQLAAKGAQMQSQNMADGGVAGGYNLGGYSDGGRLLRGPGDGVSDSIPASIGNRQPARLADGEFVVPARIVSEIGNGSTEAGARKLYAMMDRVQKARKKSIGKNKVAVNSKAEKLLPA